jgi:hypothetical protein
MRPPREEQCDQDRDLRRIEISGRVGTTREANKEVAFFVMSITVA